MSTTTYLIDLSPEDCAELLASSTLGRLGVIVDGRPEIFPVNHVYDPATASIAFPTNVGTKLHGALEWPFTAFEVDGVESDGSGGWSVMIVGRAEEITDAAEVGRLVSIRKVPWAGRDAMRWIRIVPTKLTGRRICASEAGVQIHFGRSARSEIEIGGLDAHGEQEHGPPAVAEHVSHHRSPSSAGVL